MSMKTKRELRELLKQKRGALTADEQHRMDEALIRCILASAEFRKASALLLYAPLAGEIDLLPLVRHARALGIPVAFPRCDTESLTMNFYILEPNASLVEGAYRIPEPPPSAPLCETDEHALCLLPALGYDLSGARLGYGKGYYDRFLARFSGIAAGVCYSTFLLKSIPTEPHDRSVPLLFTDRGRMVTGAKDTGADKRTAKTAAGEDPKQTNPPTGFAHVRRTVGNVLARLRKHDSRALIAQGGDEPAARPLHAPMILSGVIFLLLFLSGLADPFLINRNNEYAVMILLQVFLFAVPSVVYTKLCGDGFFPRLRMRMIRPEQAWFLLCMLVVMISGGMLCGILTGGISSLVGNFTLYDTFVARVGGGGINVLYVLLAYCLLPAFCEELVFRGILCAEYEGRGVAVSVAVSALLFSMLHFSFDLFLTYLVLGILLACAMYTVRSYFAPFLLHLLYNIFCIFGQPYLSAFYVNAGSSEIFIFCLVVIFLLFAAFAAGEARKLYHKYARAGLDSSYTAPLAWRAYPKQLFGALRTPAALVCVAIWLLASFLGGR